MPMIGNRPAPPLVAPRVSLISAAQLVDETDVRWEQGFQWVPEGCAVAGAVPLDLCAPGGITFDRPDGSPVTAFEPFGIWAADSCSTFGSSTRDFEARATRKLLAAESKMIEAELSTGTINPDSPHLQDPDVIDVGTASVEEALAVIEDELADHTAGERQMIHVRPRVLARWITNSHVRREGDIYLSPMDNIVVPGRGYTGGAPDGSAAENGSTYIYTTPVVQIRRGPITVQGSVAHRTNDATYFAMRTVSAAFDTSCARLALSATY